MAKKGGLGKGLSALFAESGLKSDLVIREQQEQAVNQTF